MNFLFWRKKVEVKEPRVLIIPPESTMEVLELLDLMQSAREKNEKVNMVRYALWSKIGKLLPETEEGQWEIITTGATKIRLIEKL